MATITCRYIDQAVKIRSYLAKDKLPFSEIRSIGNPDSIFKLDGLLSPKYLRTLASFIKDNDLTVEIQQ